MLPFRTRPNLNPDSGPQTSSAWVLVTKKKKNKKKKKTDSEAIVRVFAADTATASTAVVAQADVTVLQTVKQGIDDVNLVGVLPGILESLDDVGTVVSYGGTQNAKD